MKEVALIHSEGINAGEMKHGPLALVDENLPIVVIATMDNMHRRVLASGTHVLWSTMGQCPICCCSLAHLPSPARSICMHRPRIHRKMESVIQQLLARKAKLIIVCNTGDSAMDAFAGRPGCELIRVPRTADALQPVVNIVPLQLLSYHLTTLR